MKGRGGSSTFVRRFSSVSLPRPVVLIVLIYITPFKLCCPSGLKSNQGSWGRNECLGFDPGSRTEASFGCSQSGRLCCLQNKRRVPHYDCNLETRQIFRFSCSGLASEFFGDWVKGGRFLRRCQNVWFGYSLSILVGAGVGHIWKRVLWGEWFVILSIFCNVFCCILWTLRMLQFAMFPQLMSFSCFFYLI